MGERGELRSADRLLASAVAETLDELDLQAPDQALSRLARVYAEQIDRATGAAAAADRVLRLVFEQGAEPEVTELVGALKAKLAERTAVSDLGPKLLAALDALGASPKARAQRAKSGGVSGGGPNPLEVLRANRAG